MGDAEGKERNQTPEQARYVEKILLETVPPEKLKATVLKPGHHGSETSSTLPFINAVDPEIVVVSSGRKPFGETYIPDASTLRRYCCHNSRIRIYRTDQNDEAEHRDVTNDADGDDIVIRTNGTTIEVAPSRTDSRSASTRVNPVATDDPPRIEPPYSKALWAALRSAGGRDAPYR